MKNFFSFSRRDRNGLILFLVFICAGMAFAHFYVKRSLVNQRHQQTFILESVQLVEDLENQKMTQSPVTVSSDDIEVTASKTKSEKQPQLSTVNQKQVSVLDTLYIELNSADSLSLIALPSIGPVYAARIIKYRRMLGGYHDVNQLLEVYGFDNERLQKIKPFIGVDTTLITAINVNSATFKTVLYHPYITYELTKRIFNAQRRKPYSGLNDLFQRARIPEDTARKIAPYIAF